MKKFFLDIFKIKCMISLFDARLLARRNDFINENMMRWVGGLSIISISFWGNFNRSRFLTFISIDAGQSRPFIESLHWFRCPKGKGNSEKLKGLVHKIELFTWNGITQTLSLLFQVNSKQKQSSRFHRFWHVQNSITFFLARFI